MALYMTEFAYTREAWAALTKNPEDRTLALRALLEKIGGRLVSLHYSLGEWDGLVIFEAPDDSVATSMLLAGIAPGHLRATKTRKLMSVEEMLGALRRASTLQFRAPKAA